jgi:hypothetical protein
MVGRVGGGEFDRSKRGMECAFHQSVFMPRCLVLMHWCARPLPRTTLMTHELMHETA